MTTTEDIDLFALHNETGEILTFKASDYGGVGCLHDKRTGQVITNCGPVPWSPLYLQSFYDSKEALLKQRS